MGAAVFNSWEQVTQKLALLKTSYKKTTIIFASTAATSAILFGLSFFTGIPYTDKQFWMAALTTGLLNALAYPLMLKAYQVGEFSSVYSMILLTPVFLIELHFHFRRKADNARNNWYRDNHCRCLAYNAP